MTAETFTHNGRLYQMEIAADEWHGSPWDEECGHGPVSDWTTRAKAPGEMVLAQDGRSFRYYDFAEACRIARAEGWDAAPYGVPGETARQRAAKAARADYEHLHRWCNGGWQYVGVIVTALCDCCESPTGPSASLWGIESDASDYLRDVAGELADEIEREALAA